MSSEGIVARDEGTAKPLSTTDNPSLTTHYSPSGKSAEFHDARLSKTADALTTNHSPLTTKYRQARFDEPLLSELMQTTCKVCAPAKIPSKMARSEIKLPNLSELEVVRHFTHLSQMNFGVDSGFYPLGSCTMKYNMKICDETCALDGFAAPHPLQHESTVQGSLELMYKLEKAFCEIAGMDSFTLQPAAGAHGEFTGILLIRAYHEARKDKERAEIIITDTAHGTNPASAAMAGYKVIEIPSAADGTVNLEALKAALSPRTAGIMLTNPNTLGIFEDNILEVARLVHEAGGLLYYDGANLNGMMGRARPGDMGFDVVHLNLHKTFGTPHGGGGPGSGPVGVKKILEPFLPVPRIVENNGKYKLDYRQKKSIGKIRAFYGNFAVLVRAYTYILMMGGDGLRLSSEYAVLNANYIKKKVIDGGDYSMPFKYLRKHESVISAKPLKEKYGITTLNIAKRLLEMGFHAPTIYFPHLVEEAIMTEPTESETKDTLDTYIAALLQIAKEAKENPDIVKSAPQTTIVGKLDETAAARKPILTWAQL